MILSCLAPFALAGLSVLTPQGSLPTEGELFPPSSALAEGLSPDSLAALDELIQSFVDDEEIVGAELLVIKNGKSVLHEAYGWRDREAELAMETGNVYCVRSMTKPLIGASILMLTEDGALKLSDRASQHLAAFDTDTLRQITIEQLLHHTSGLPMSQIMAWNLNELDGIQAVAALGAKAELEFPPGTDFNYSDQGTDTLTAIVELVSGMSAAEFVSTRLLEPLGMQSSTCLLREAHPLRERACSKYVGTAGSWTRYWSPDEPPLFPFFLGSQGLYSTVEDYARFMQLWQNRGRAGGERLLKPRSVRAALEPGPFAFNSSTGFPDLRLDYGYLMQLWTRAGEDGEREVVGFGHTGSDGTHAWVLPEQKAMVLYFTQSRNGTTGLRVEEALGRLFLGAPFDANAVAPPFDDYLGYYFEGEGDLYRAIVRDGDDLALEIMGKGIVPLSYIGEDRWKLRPNPSVVLAFDRSETGEVTGYHIGDHQEFRFEPAESLPSAEELAELVAKTYRLDLMEQVGPIRIKSKISIAKLDMTGESTVLLGWPGKYRYEAKVGEQNEQASFDGERVWHGTQLTPPRLVEGEHAQTMRLDHAFAHYGDWFEWYPGVRVVQVLHRSDQEVFVVRGGDTSAPATTLYVHGSTGHVVAVDSMIFGEGTGRIGQHVEYGDFHEVAGMLFPYSTETELANPMIGPIIMTVQEIELGVEASDEAFALD